MDPARLKSTFPLKGAGSLRHIVPSCLVPASSRVQWDRSAIGMSVVPGAKPTNTVLSNEPAERRGWSVRGSQRHSLGLHAVEP